MNSQSEHPTRSSRPIAVLLTIILQLGLAYYLYQQAIQADPPSRNTTRTEQVQTTP